MATHPEPIADESDPNEAKENVPAVDDVKGLSSKAITPDPVKGAHGNLMPASKARNL